MAPPPFPAADVRWQWRGVGHIGARRADGAPSPDVTLGHAAQAARLRSRAVRRAIARRTALLRQHERHRISTPNAASATRPARTPRPLPPTDRSSTASIRRPERGQAWLSQVGVVAISFYLSRSVIAPTLRVARRYDRRRRLSCPSTVPYRS